MFLRVFYCLYPGQPLRLPQIDSQVKHFRGPARDGTGNPATACTVPFAPPERRKGFGFFRIFLPGLPETSRDAASKQIRGQRPLTLILQRTKLARHRPVAGEAVPPRLGTISCRSLSPCECYIGFDKWVFPLANCRMTTKLTLDRAGRVLIPKTLRQEWRLNPGDALQLDSQGEETVTLRPVRPKALLKKELGVWVYQGETTAASIPALIDREREKRLRELLG